MPVVIYQLYSYLAGLITVFSLFSETSLEFIIFLKSQGFINANIQSRVDIYRLGYYMSRLQRRLL